MNYFSTTPCLKSNQLVKSKKEVICFKDLLLVNIFQRSKEPLIQRSISKFLLIFFKVPYLSYKPWPQKFTADLKYFQ